MGDDDSFANVPPSIGELRAKKLGRASEQSPRDTLVQALRDLDSGKIKPRFLLVMMGGESDDENDPPNTMISEQWLGGKHNYFELIGLVLACLRQLLIRD